MLSRSSSPAFAAIFSGEKYVSFTEINVSGMGKNVQ
jgi:hypothetical protein